MTDLAETDVAAAKGKDAPRQARSAGPSVQDILAADAVPAEGTLREVAYEDLGSEDIPRERYTSRAWHELEVEKLWRRCWQMACREEELAAPGDTVVYEVADISIVLVRTEAGEIRGYHNACLHRGATLRAGDGNVPELRCPFHGFTWSLDGDLTAVPCEWDFPHVRAEEFRLPEVLVDTWAGWVFINVDLEATSLAEHLGGLPEHFPWKHEDFSMQAHVAKVLPCNWKVALDAFIESFHVIATHPQLLTMLGDANTQYDVFPGEPRWNRMITAQGVQSPHLPPMEEQEIMDSMIGQFMPAGAYFPVPEGQTARALLGMLQRGQIQALLGPDAQVSDSEALDAIEYYVFPNFMPWGAFSRINYRFRPHDDSPDQCVMDVMLLAPCAPGKPRPKPAACRWLGLDDPWTDAPELGGLATIFVQDTANIPRIQRGLRASVKPGITLGSYQEVRIRHYHRELERWVEG